MDMKLLWVILAAFAGAVAAALLGWSESAEAFVFRKFLGSILRGLLAALVFGVGYQFTDGLGVWGLASAFLGGAGLDVIGKKGMGAIKIAIQGATTPPSFEGLDKLLDEAQAKGWAIREIKAEAKKRGILLG